MKSDGVIRVDIDCESCSRALRRVGDTSDVVVGLKRAPSVDGIAVDKEVVTLARFVRVASTSLLCSSCKAVNLPASKLSYRMKRMRRAKFQDEFPKECSHHALKFVPIGFSENGANFCMYVVRTPWKLPPGQVIEIQLDGLLSEVTTRASSEFHGIYRFP